MVNLCYEKTKYYQKDKIKQLEDLCKEVRIAVKVIYSKYLQKIESITWKFKINHTSSVNKLDWISQKDN